MAYTKAFPKRSDKAIYPQWEDILLTPEEEAVAERECRRENNNLMASCLEDAKALLKEKGFKGYESSVVSLAAALFEKRASHVAYWKEELAREKFGRQH
jgi:hypothetical protein